MTEAGQGSVDTPITGVTVFTDGARVTRAGVTPVQQGVRPVVVARLGRRREIAARKRAAQRELDAALERLAGAEHPSEPVVYTEVSVLLDAAAATEAEFELTYHVTGAFWHPLYDLVLEGEKLSVS